MNESLDKILKFLNINKKDFEYTDKITKMKRAENTLSTIVANKTKKANKYLSDINAKYEDIRYKGPVNLSLHYYKDPGKILVSFIAMEYTICGNINEVDDNIKSFLYRTIIPEIIAEYNKTKIADTVKIKEGSMLNATIILYQ